jgi:oligo-1,6-glucosidase
VSRADRSLGDETAWWKEAVVYEIYPRSFYDADGDGVGDLQGIVEKADYLAELGIDVVWLCPVYDSPQADNGYDIRDYRAIDDTFGSMADWERVRDVLHDRDIRLIMDLVVNHTSDEHEWFRRSRRGDPEYADFYHWLDGRPADAVDYRTDRGPDGEVPPTNWESNFGGPAWSYDDEREQWYLHVFDEKQPDLNWRTPRVRREVKALMEWWLEKGIDGFRMDAINILSKADGYPDGDPAASPTGREHVYNGPRLEAYLRELHDDVLSAYDAVTVAEMALTPVETAEVYLDAGLDMIFQFEHMDVDVDPDRRWDPDSDWGEWSLVEFKRIVSRWQTELDGWNAVYLGNHDQPRIVSRFGDDEHRVASGKLLATFLLTMGGTPYLYQGDEIGMTNAEFDALEELDDVETIGAVESRLATGQVESFDAVRDLVNYATRDHARTPVQWTDGPHAGFTDGDGEPWFRVNDDYPTVNVRRARADEGSIWHHYRRLIDLRREWNVLVYGAYDCRLPDHEQLFVYTRTLRDQRWLVVLNWSSTPARLPDLELPTEKAEVIIDSADDAPADPTGAEFRPYQATVYRLPSTGG